MASTTRKTGKKTVGGKKKAGGGKKAPRLKPKESSSSCNCQQPSAMVHISRNWKVNMGDYESAGGDVGVSAPYDPSIIGDRERVLEEITAWADEVAKDNTQTLKNARSSDL